MHIVLAGENPCGKTAGVWPVLQNILNKSLWIAAGVFVIMGIVGCSSTPQRSVERNTSYRVGGNGSSIDYSSPSRTGTKVSPRLVRSGRIIPKGGGVFKIGNPYRVAGRLYVPRSQPNYDKIGKASWYGVDFHGRQTANREIFDMNALTAAHPTLPLPSYAYVTNLKNNRTVLVRINDRGPYAHNRIIDLSRAVARVLGFENQGVTNVRVRYAGRAPLSGNDRREVRYLAAQPWSKRYSRSARYGRGYSGLGGPRIGNSNADGLSQGHAAGRWSWSRQTPHPLGSSGFALLRAD